MTTWRNFGPCPNCPKPDLHLRRRNPRQNVFGLDGRAGLGPKAVGTIRPRLASPALEPHGGIERPGSDGTGIAYLLLSRPVLEAGKRPLDIPSSFTAAPTMFNENAMVLGGPFLSPRFPCPRRRRPRLGWFAVRPGKLTPALGSTIRTPRRPLRRYAKGSTKVRVKVSPCSSVASCDPITPHRR